MVSWIEIGGFYAGHMGKERSRSRSALEARSAYNERYTFSDLGRMFFRGVNERPFSLIQH